MTVLLSVPVKSKATVSRESCTGPLRYSVSGASSSASGGAPSYSTAPVSHFPFCGRRTPRWSVSGHGLAPASIASEP